MPVRQLTFAAALILTVSVAVLGAGRAQASTCAEAARSAEQHNGLPAGLLAAIGAVESGGWGWSVNGNDGMAGRRFATAEEARHYTEELLGSGLRTIDLGCFQVDLRYHPDAFQRWQDAFDEDVNAGAAAGILNRLYAQTGDWHRAVALYHSADPARGQSYLEAVMSAWGGRPAVLSEVAEVTEMAEDRTHEIELRPVFVPVAVWGPTTMLVSGGTRRFRNRGLPRIITP